MEKMSQIFASVIWLLHSIELVMYVVKKYHELLETSVLNKEKPQPTINITVNSHKLRNQIFTIGYWIKHTHMQVWCMRAQDNQSMHMWHCEILVLDLTGFNCFIPYVVGYMC